MQLVKLTCQIITGDFPLSIAAFITLAKVSWILSELTRDYWHFLCHHVPFLYRHIHSPHHKAYRQNYQVRSLKLYRKDRLTHAITECLLMLICTSTFSSLALHLIEPWYQYGCLYGVLHSLDELGRAVSGAINPRLGIKLDKLHVSGTLIEAPRKGRVTSTYHLPHHDLDPMVAFSGVNPLFDQLIGTAKSYRKLTFGFIGNNDGFDGELLVRLRQEGAKVKFLPSCWSALQVNEQRAWLRNIDVLVFIDL